MATVITITISDAMESRYLAAAQTLGATTIQEALQGQMETFLVQYEGAKAQTTQSNQTRLDIAADPLVVQ